MPTTQPAETEKKQLHLLSDSPALTCCPKCQGALEPPVVRCVGEGFQFVHQCKECSASFALVPFTTLGVYELPSRNWKDAN
jgi:predicted amidophosphoribosyltransferase